MDILATSFAILPAEEADIPALAETLTWSHISEAVMSFFFLDWPRTDIMLQYMADRLAGKFAEPQSKIFKAVDATSGAILGLVCMTLETGEEVADRKFTSPGTFEPPPGFDWGFAQMVVEGLGKLDWNMVGKKHYMVSSLAVDPKHHKKGLGTRLMDHCHQIADKDGLAIYLNAFPGAHHLYLKWGYENVEKFDVDLGAYGEKYRGFGIYRTWAMIRQPKKR
ncbi:acyl-CoA N-acyltransferase [Mollisia scopiformis]|uniref:Acyl-CoA N-acyltransferase n=1 Tax=Mollisia scopiformis TaxID=149040 RepID=A0A132B5J8_MOLSC|nr:acyl-CoA N-acyltransferase [Mollisia scopiformis]KUJ07680.1 acyl-CoA N-acyltransferase [Mollisia scopiformis]